MNPSPVYITLAMLLLVLLSAEAGASAGIPDPGELVHNGHYPEALELLRTQSKTQPEDTNTLFLLGLSAMESALATSGGENAREALLDEAIQAFRTILINQPDLVRVRLELARAFYHKGEDRLSRKEFERVLAGKPPAAVVANVQRFLSEMRARKRWSMYVGTALAPSTNIGKSSDTEIVEIFGLPFVLDEKQERKSGVGLSIWTGGSYQLPLTQRLQLRFGSDLAREEYPGREFDQTFMGAHTGVRWLMDHNTSVSLLADTRRRWTAGAPFYQDFGARTEIKHRLTRSILLAGRASWHDRKYRKHTLLDGDVVNLSLKGTWLATPILQTEGTIGYGKENTKTEPWRHDYLMGRLGVSMALPRGFTIGGSGEYRRTQYEGNWFPETDGSARRDYTRILRASIYNRGFTVLGFSPQLVISREERTTNTQTYDYRDTSGELQIVRQF